MKRFCAIYHDIFPLTAPTPPITGKSYLLQLQVREEGKNERILWIAWSTFCNIFQQKVHHLTLWSWILKKSMHVPHQKEWPWNLIWSKTQLFKWDLRLLINLGSCAAACTSAPTPLGYLNLGYVCIPPGRVQPRAKLTSFVPALLVLCKVKHTAIQKAPSMQPSTTLMFSELLRHTPKPFLLPDLQAQAHAKWADLTSWWCNLSGSWIALFTL